MPSAGPVGVVAGGRATLLARPDRPSPLPDADGPRTVRVGLVTIVLGDDGELLRAAVGRFDGLVIAAFGIGNVPARLVPAVAELAERLPVVLASRTGAGNVLASHRGLAGAENELLTHRGVISAGFLNPLKARLLLHVLLAGNASRDQVSTAFAAYGGG